MIKEFFGSSLDSLCKTPLVRSERRGGRIGKAKLRNFRILQYISIKIQFIQLLKNIYEAHAMSQTPYTGDKE